MCGSNLFKIINIPPGMVGVACQGLICSAKIIFIMLFVGRINVDGCTPQVRGAVHTRGSLETCPIPCFDRHNSSHLIGLMTVTLHLLPNTPSLSQHHLCILEPDVVF